MGAPFFSKFPLGETKNLYALITLTRDDFRIGPFFGSLPLGFPIDRHVFSSRKGQTTFLERIGGRLLKQRPMSQLYENISKQYKERRRYETPSSTNGIHCDTSL